MSEHIASGSGTAVTAYNNNRNSTTTSILTIKATPAITASGTLIRASSKGLDGATPSKATITGKLDRGTEMILKSGTTYLYEIKSVGASNIVDYDAAWYEHTDKIQQF